MTTNTTLFHSLRYRDAGSSRTPGAPVTIAPGALRVAESSLTDVDLPTPRYAAIGVLVDTLHWRILLGSPPLIRSTFAKAFTADLELMSSIEYAR